MNGNKIDKKYHFHHHRHHLNNPPEEAVVDNVLKQSILKSFAHRFPWLFLGLIGGVLAAKIVEGFEKTLTENLILAAFIPVIVYMADAVGTQMESFIIRDLAIEGKIKFHKYFFRQFTVVFLIGIVSSSLLYIAANFFYKDVNISFVLAVALFAAIMSSLFTGLIIPYIFRRSRIDPANVSGPIATIIQDLLSIVIYFLVAEAML